MSGSFSAPGSLRSPLSKHPSESYLHFLQCLYFLNFSKIVLFALIKAFYQSQCTFFLNSIFFSYKFFLFFSFLFFFLKGKQKKRDYLERRLIAVWGENSPQRCAIGLGVAGAGHIGSAVSWGSVRDGAGGCGAGRRSASPRLSAAPKKVRGCCALLTGVPPQKGSGQLACKFKCGLWHPSSLYHCTVSAEEETRRGGGGGGGGFIHRLLKRSAASATPQSSGWEGRQRGGKAAPRACGRDRLPPSSGTPTSRRFFLTSKYQSAWGQPRSPFSGSLRNIARCARKPLPSHPSPPPLPRPPRCGCWLRGKEPPGSCGGRPAGDHWVPSVLLGSKRNSVKISPELGYSVFTRPPSLPVPSEASVRVLASANLKETLRQGDPSET